MLLYETKLPFAYPCRSTWPRCNTVYCRWGRYGTTEITNTNAIAATRVSQGSHTLYRTQGNGLSMENQGNIREFTKQLREFFENSKISGNSQWMAMGDLSASSDNVMYFFHMFCLQFPDKTTGKIGHSLIYQGLIYVAYIPMVNWWMSCIQLNNGVHFHFMKILMVWT